MPGVSVGAIPGNLGVGPNHAANGGGRWTVQLTALAKAAFRGPNPGPTEVLDDTATELRFFFQVLSTRYD